jgi:toxin ParE1/3/4
MNVRWTEAAVADLQALRQYIARHSARYAQSMVERIFARTEVLADHPRLGSVVPEYEEETLRELIEDPYRIIYRVLEQQVDVVAIIHSARRLDRKL